MLNHQTQMETSNIGKFKTDENTFIIPFKTIYFENVNGVSETQSKTTRECRTRISIHLSEGTPGSEPGSEVGKSKEPIW